MGRSVIAGLLLIVFGTLLTAQPKLILSGLATGSIDSRLYRFDPASGAFQSVFNAQLGQLVDVRMDQSNTGFTAVFHGPSGYGISGIHSLTTLGGNRASLAWTSFTNGPMIQCAELTSEDVWVTGTDVWERAGRVQRVTPGPFPTFIDLRSFQDASIRRVLVERARANLVLAVNTAAGAVVSYDVFRQSTLTLAAGLQPIVDIDQDPFSGTYLVATNDPASPIVSVHHDGIVSSVTTFGLPPRLFPTGMNVEAMTVVSRGENANCDLWLAGNGRLVRLEWDGTAQRIVYPSPLVSYPLPPGGAVTGMIVEGGRDSLLIRGTHPNGWTLKMRLGPTFANLRYALAGSFGVAPGVPVTRRRMINLAPDPLFFATAADQMPEIFEDFQGVVGPEGEVTGQVRVPPPIRRSCLGITIFFAGVLIDPGVPGGIRTTTNTVGFVML